jgi:hypothetical protein
LNHPAFCHASSQLYYHGGMELRRAALAALITADFEEKQTLRKQLRY